jgi:hypothetical protein
LADEYRSAGYVAVSRLFAHDPHMKSIVTTEKPPTIWRCGDNVEQMGEVRNALALPENLIRSGQYDRAQEAIEVLMKKYGPACPLLADWSQAVLYSAMAGAHVSDETEVAVRLLTTCADELNVMPGTMFDTADVYEFLALYFCAIRDYASCASSLEMALSRVENGSVVAGSRVDVGRWRSRLNERLQYALTQLARE